MLYLLEISVLLSKRRTLAVHVCIQCPLMREACLGFLAVLNQQKRVCQIRVLRLHCMMGYGYKELTE